MKIDFKHNDSVDMFSYRWKLGNFKQKKHYPSETSFTKFNPDLLDQMYEDFIYNIFGYCKYVNKNFKKHIIIKKPHSNNIADIQDALPANGHDIYNYAARYGIGNYQLQSIMKLNGNLDFDKLLEAIRLSIDAEPIFKCRFIENEPPYWRLSDDIDISAFYSLEETDNADMAVQKFLDSPLDMDHDPMVKVKLIRSERYDTLCIKVNHACCDGTGIKEYIQLLADIYSCIDEENGIFIPEPKNRTRKEQDTLFCKLGISDPDAAWIPESEIKRVTWPFPWKPDQSDETHVAFCRLSYEQFDKITHYAKAMGATINDLILTAFYRAMQGMGIPIYGEAMEIPITVDLRRYLPDKQTDAIRNFSGSENTCLSMVANESFSETLSRVILMMQEIKNRRPGLQSAIGLERLEKMSLSKTLDYIRAVSQGFYYYSDKCSPTLSNLGFISNSLLKFGKNLVTDAYIVAPAVRAPGLLVMSSTYNGVLTLVCNFYKASVQQDDIEKLLNKVKNELIESCKQ